jgi:hypothetical protein
MLAAHLPLREPVLCAINIFREIRVQIREIRVNGCPPYGSSPVALPFAVRPARLRLP